MKFLVIPFLFCLMALISLPVKAQEIHRVRIEELERYMEQSDHPLVLSFWATWCLPCIHEIPWLIDAVDKYRSGKPELVLISLDFEESYPKKIQRFVRDRNFRARFYWLDETDADHFCPKIDSSWSGGIPATLFLNPVTGYRKFISRQLTDRQALAEVGKLVDSVASGEQAKK